MSQYASRAQGVHGSGSRSHHQVDVERVLHILCNECRGPERRITVERLADRVDLSGRAVRDIVRELELAGRVLCDFADGYFVCETAEQSRRSTRRLQSQVANMQARIVARSAMAEQLN